MIIVKNRQLLMSNDEQYIGTTYDKDSTSREFKIDRINEDGFDMAGLIFKIDLKYTDTGTSDTDMPDMDIGERDIHLTWLVPKTVTAHYGAIYIQLRAFDEAGVQKWSSFKNVIYVEDYLGQVAPAEGTLTELEKIEAKINGVLRTEDERNTAENKRTEAEKDRDAAEKKREKAFDDAIEDFNTDRQELKDYATASKSYAVGGTGSRENEDTDNAKYYYEGAAVSASDAHDYMKECEKMTGIVTPVFTVSFEDGNVKYNDDCSYTFAVNESTGNLEYELKEAFA